MHVSLVLAAALTILGFATTVYAQSAGVVGSQYESKADNTCSASVCTVSFPPNPSATVIKITRANCIAVSATEPFEVDLRISASSGGPVLKTQYLDIAHSLKGTTGNFITTVNSEVEMLLGVDRSPSIAMGAIGAITVLRCTLSGTVNK